MWIERFDDIFDSTISLTLSNVDDIERSIDTTQLYSRIDIGSSINQADEGTFQWPDVAFFGHKEETYHLSGVNNVDVIFDLVGDWIVDSNVIEDIMVTPNDEYDDDIVLVEADFGAGQAVQYDLFNVGGVPYVYNYEMINEQSMSRHLRGIPNDVALYLGDGDDGFLATRTASTTHAVNLAATLWDYDTEVSDPNANYDNTAGNYKYTAPTTGFYRFLVTQLVEFNTWSIPFIVNVNIFVIRYTAAAVQVEQRSTQVDFSDDASGAVTFAVSGGDPNTLLSGSSPDWTIAYNGPGFYMDATDYVQVQIQMTITLGSANLTLNGGQFETSEVQTGGGIFQVQDPNDARIVQYKFTHPLSFTDFETISDNNQQMIAFTGANDGNTYRGWINKVSYSPESGTADFELITSINDQE